MRDKKHIDRLFKEGLKDFEPVPSDAVWKKIEAELNTSKNTRRIIPIWWRYAGVAALLLLFLGLGINGVFNSSEDIEQQEVVDTETTRSSKIGGESISGNNTSGSIKTVVSNEEIQKETVNKKSEIVKTASKEKDSPINSNVNTIKKRSLASSNRLSEENRPIDPAKTNIVTDSESEKNTVISSYKAQNNLTPTATKDVVAETKIEEKVIPNEIVANTKNRSLTIEEALAKAHSIIIEKKEKDGRWSIAANAAPVYFNTSGEGSAIDPQFNSNSKSGEVYISYGISARYALTDRLSVRSGISNLSLGYNIDNVVVYEAAGVSSVSSKPLQNVSTSKLSTVRVSSQVLLVSGEGLDANIQADFIDDSRTSISQNLRYVEVPVELQYALVNKKIGLNVIGGFSSLFLNGNEIFTDTERTKSYFSGEASNINEVSYSANFGLGLNYQLNKTIDLNLEPMIKYQINTFKNTFGDFKPYYVGVYTGVAIKF
ncbi:outer membrane beta-barrel protein [Algibacter pacificus]|uniref:outer membrane beta-barrel protein n=1 Tax=Algibacter pacificus TaxID=2599389 RepID=UPI0011CA247C|nr:outer membrane beta-barrel protein [Algibacter pacificus]